MRQRQRDRKYNFSFLVFYFGDLNFASGNTTETNRKKKSIKQKCEDKSSFNIVIITKHSV